MYPCNYEASNLNVHASMQYAKNYTMPDESQHDSCFRTMYNRMHFKKLFTKKKDIIHDFLSYNNYIKNFFEIYKETNFCYFLLLSLWKSANFNLYMFHNLLKLLGIYIKTSCVSSEI